MTNQIINIHNKLFLIETEIICDNNYIFYQGIINNKKAFYNSQRKDLKLDNPLAENRILEIWRDTDRGSDLYYWTIYCSKLKKSLLLYDSGNLSMNQTVPIDYYQLIYRQTK